MNNFSKFSQKNNLLIILLNKLKFNVMRKKLLSFVLIFTLFIGKAWADEGMWLLFLLQQNYDEMQAKGLNLTPEQIYSINEGSLKDAIVRMGGGFCTGEIISSEGLLLTNHHCGYSVIQSHSSVENDYLKNGFWAMNKSEEIPNPDLTISFLVRVEDVSEQVLKDIPFNMSETERTEKIESAIVKIEEDAIAGTNYEAEVKAFFAGNEYYLMVYETYKDIRLVGTPPESIGKFGGDTDNWMWPRHTGDFCLFRVYTAPDGSPAEYSPENIPLKPRHHLPVSLKGVQKNDFAMILGYPGNTDRYLTSFGVRQAMEITNPTHVEVRAKILDIMKEAMDADPAVRIQYASKYAGVSNYWKYFIGQTKGLEKLDVFGKKVAIEEELIAWIKADVKRQEKYGELLQELEQLYLQKESKAKGDVYLKELLLYGNFESVIFSYNFFGLYQALQAGGEEGIQQQIEVVKPEMEKHFKDFNAAIDEKILGELSQMYFENMPSEQQPSYLAEANEEYSGDFSAFAQATYANSIFSSQERAEAFLENPDLTTLDNDPIFQIMLSMVTYYRQQYVANQEVDAEMNKLRRHFIAALREMNQEKNYYPDANSTMRLTYGVVNNYSYEGEDFPLLTYLEGVIAKEDKNNPEFFVEKRLIKLYKKKDYGRYVDSNGKLPVCFITNNDITGGNSGSPVINGDGQLIGTAFDGNWEAMSGDIAFEPELQRCICVDIRYVLFIIDKFAGAGHLVEEMTLVE